MDRYRILQLSTNTDMNGYKDEYLTLKEAAAYLRVSMSTIRRWIRKDDFPAVKAGRKYIVAKLDIPTFLRKYEKE